MKGGTALVMKSVFKIPCETTGGFQFEVSIGRYTDARNQKHGDYGSCGLNIPRKGQRAHHVLQSSSSNSGSMDYNTINNNAKVCSQSESKYD